MDKKWSLRLEGSWMKAFSGYSVLVAVVLNCPVFSHKGDSSKQKQRFCAITDFSRVIGQAL
jgi:hypothetical protein